MDKHLVGLEKAQEEFHQAFNTHMEDMENDMQVVKMDVNVLQIRMSSTEGEVPRLQSNIRDLGMSMDNSHLRLEKVEDRVDGLVESLR